MHHRTLTFLVLAVIMAMSSGHLDAEDQTKAARPNIIYTMVDDRGYGDVGCFGQKVIQTPNIDRLAAEAIKFTNHSQGPPYAVRRGRCDGPASTRGTAGKHPDVVQKILSLLKRDGLL